MTIRRARLSDLSRIVSIYAMDSISGHRELLPVEKAGQYTSAFLTIDNDPNQLLLVAEISGTVVGTIQITVIQHLMNKGMKRAVFEAVFIDTAYQGQGIGSKLLDAANAWSAEMGCSSIELTSNKKRERAHGFYSRAGFSRSHEGFKKQITGA